MKFRSNRVDYHTNVLNSFNEVQSHIRVRTPYLNRDVLPRKSTEASHAASTAAMESPIPSTATDSNGSPGKTREPANVTPPCTKPSSSRQNDCDTTMTLALLGPTIPPAACVRRRASPDSCSPGRLRRKLSSLKVVKRDNEIQLLGSLDWKKSVSGRKRSRGTMDIHFLEDCTTSSDMTHNPGNSDSTIQSSFPKRSMFLQHSPELLLESEDVLDKDGSQPCYESLLASQSEIVSSAVTKKHRMRSKADRRFPLLELARHGSFDIAFWKTNSPEQQGVAALPLSSMSFEPRTKNREESSLSIHDKESQEESDVAVDVSWYSLSHEGRTMPIEQSSASQNFCVLPDLELPPSQTSPELVGGPNTTVQVDICNSQMSLFRPSIPIPKRAIAKRTASIDRKKMNSIPSKSLAYRTKITICSSAEEDFSDFLMSWTLPRCKEARMHDPCTDFMDDDVPAPTQLPKSTSMFDIGGTFMKRKRQFPRTNDGRLRGENGLTSTMSNMFRSKMKIHRRSSPVTIAHIHKPEKSCCKRTTSVEDVRHTEPLALPQSVIDEVRAFVAKKPSDGEMESFEARVGGYPLSSWYITSESEQSEAFSSRRRKAKSITESFLRIASEKSNMVTAKHALLTGCLNQRSKKTNNISYRTMFSKVSVDPDMFEKRYMRMIRALPSDEKIMIDGRSYMALLHNSSFWLALSLCQQRYAEAIPREPKESGACNSIKRCPRKRIVSLLDNLSINALAGPTWDHRDIDTSSLFESMENVGKLSMSVRSELLHLLNRAVQLSQSTPLKVLKPDASDLDDVSWISPPDMPPAEPSPHEHAQIKLSTKKMRADVINEESREHNRSRKRRKKDKRKKKRKKEKKASRKALSATTSNGKKQKTSLVESLPAPTIPHSHEVLPSARPVPEKLAELSNVASIPKIARPAVEMDPTPLVTRDTMRGARPPGGEGIQKIGGILPQPKPVLAKPSIEIDPTPVVTRRAGIAHDPSHDLSVAGTNSSSPTFEETGATLQDAEQDIDYRGVGADDDRLGSPYPIRAAPAQQHKENLLPDESTVGVLCSESFIQTWGETISELASGGWTASFFSDAEGGSQATAFDDAPIAGRKIAVFDSSLVDAAGVDIELPGRKSIVVCPISAWIETSSKPFVFEIIQLAATRRYDRIDILICADTDITMSLSQDIATLQNAIVRELGCQQTMVLYQILSPAALSAAIAQRVLSSVGSIQDASVSSWDAERYLSDRRFQERGLFLMSVVPMLTARGVLQCLTKPLAVLTSGGEQSADVDFSGVALQSLLCPANASQDLVVRELIQSSCCDVTPLIMSQLRCAKTADLTTIAY